MKPCRWLSGVGLMVLLALAVLAAWQLDFDWSRLLSGWTNLSVWWELPTQEFTPLFWQQISWAFYETFLMAYLGTFLGVFLSLPLVLLAGRPVSGGWFNFLLRGLFGFLRSTPALLWAVIAVVVVGLGPLAGTLALTLVTMGYFGKLATDEFDHLPRTKAQALKATGASQLALIRFVYWPALKPKFMVTALFLFEYNIRHSSILGLVGAGGIGYYIAAYLKWLEYGVVLLLIGLVFVVVMLLEWITALLKRWCQPPEA